MRKCSYCGVSYTDEKPHDYDACVVRVESYLQHAQHLLDTHTWALEQAKVVQASDWWRLEVAKRTGDG